MPEVLDIALAVGLLGCFAGAAFLAAAEVSILRVRRSQIHHRGHGDDRNGPRLQRLLEDLPHVFNAVLLLALLFQVSAATLGGLLAARLFGGVGASVSAVVITAALFVYAEAIPKAKAVSTPDRVALAVTPALAVITPVVRPVVSALVRLTELHVGPGHFAVSPLTEHELRMLARESATAGEIAAGDAALVDRSFEFNDRLVHEVMVTRSDIVAVSAESTAEDALEVAIRAGHRRLPVFGETLDDIIGMVRLRDLAVAPDGVQVATLVGDVLATREDLAIPQLLKQMQSTGRWLAIVFDDGRQTVGLVTIEDVVAELVGEIVDA